MENNNPFKEQFVNKSLLSKLKECLSNNSNIRKEAENFFALKNNENPEILFSQMFNIFTYLVENINSENIQIFQMCSLFLKNMIIDGNYWFYLSFLYQNEVRKTLYFILNNIANKFSDNQKKYSCLILSAISYKEYQKQNSIMLNSIISNIISQDDSNNKNINIWYLYTIKLIFEKFQNEKISLQISNQLLSQLILIIQNSNQLIITEDAMYFSLEIIILLLPYCKHYFENQPNYIILPIIDLIMKSPSKKIVKICLNALYDMIYMYHQYIVKDIAKMIPLLNIIISKSLQMNEAELIQSALDIFCLIGDKEQFNKTIISDYFSTSSKEIAVMLIHLIELNRDIQIENDDWNITKASCYFLSFLIQSDVNNNLLEIVLIKVSESFNDISFTKQFNSLIILSACLETPHKDTLINILNPKDLINKLNNNKNNIISYTISWILGKMSEMIPIIFKRKDFHEMIPQLVNIIRNRNIHPYETSINISVVLGNLLKYYGDEDTLSNDNVFKSYYKEFVNKFIDDCIIEDNIKSGLSFYLIRVIMNVVQYSSKDLQDSLEIILGLILDKFIIANELINKTQKKNQLYFQLEESLCLIMNQIFHKIIRNVDYNLSRRIYKAILNSFNLRGSSYESGILCLFNPLIILQPEEFNGEAKKEIKENIDFDEVMPYILESIISGNDILIQSGICVLHNLCWFKSFLIDSYSNKIFKMLFTILSNDSLKQSTQLMAISLIGDFCFNLSDLQEDQITLIFPLIFSAFDLIYPMYNEGECGTLLTNLIETCSMIIISVHKRNKERIVFKYIKQLIQNIMNFSTKEISKNVRNNLILLFGDIINVLGERIREFSYEDEVFKLCNLLKKNSDERYFQWMNELVNKIFTELKIKI